jgi:hypothetical protein
LHLPLEHSLVGVKSGSASISVSSQGSGTKSKISASQQQELCFSVPR